MNVVQGDRARHALVLDQFHLGVVRTHHERDGRLLIRDEGQIVFHLLCGRELGARHHGIAGRLDFVHSRAKVRHPKPDVVDRRAFCPAAWRARRQHDEHIRKLDDLGRRCADFDRRAAKSVHPEFLVRVHAGDVQMMVAVDDGTVFRGNELRRRGRVKDQNEQERREHRFHEASVQRGPILPARGADRVFVDGVASKFCWRESSGRPCRAGAGWERASTRARAAIPAVSSPDPFTRAMSEAIQNAIDLNEKRRDDSFDDRAHRVALRRRAEAFDVELNLCDPQPGNGREPAQREKVQ